jgi:hypothetical protein
MAAFLERIARQTGRTKSQVVREALEILRVRSAREHRARPAEIMADLIGVWDSGGARLSERTGERFAQILQEKAHARSAGRRRSARRTH